MPLTGPEFIRYNRHIMVDKIAEQGQVKLKNSKVLIIGMGGLGCPAAQYLVASGVGELTLVDHDEIEISNLQRQVLYTTEDVGKAKVEVAKRQLSALNPHCRIDAIKDSVFYVDLSLILADIDVVLDCTDSAKTRKFINQEAQHAGVFLVSASAIQGSGQLVSFDFSIPSSPCYACIFPDSEEQTQNCSTAGVLSPLLGVMGSLQATETIRLLLGMNNNLNKLMLFDAWGMETRNFGIKKSSNCDVCKS